MSLRTIQNATNLSCPTVIDCLDRLENLGLVVHTMHKPGHPNTYYIPGPPPAT
jgi:DNA-binding transcriptional regulator GbsR (MarR family)